MADQELDADQIAALEAGGDIQDTDTDRPDKVSEGREARDSADAATYAALIAGKGVTANIGQGALSTDEISLSSFINDNPAADGALTDKAIEQDLRKHVYSVGSTFYVSASARETAMRSLQKQGVKVSTTDLTSVQGVRGARTRFNSFSTRHPKYYASGSWKSGGGGPRIQGPSGGPGSCKFIIVQR